VKALIRQAEEILEVAISSPNDATTEFAILFSGEGGMRILDGAGWGLAGLLSEFGARAVYRVERRGRRIRVEGWSGLEKCLLERETPQSPCSYTPSYYSESYATRSQAMPLAIAGSNECSPQVLNSYLSM
jgi:hypothetical protein